MANLAAFAPLFPAARKYRYASSVLHFLAQVCDDVQLQELLKMVCSVNITHEGHYLAFDKALEIYGVKFIKQNITGNLVDDRQKSRQPKVNEIIYHCFLQNALVMLWPIQTPMQIIHIMVWFSL